MRLVQSAAVRIAVLYSCSTLLGVARDVIVLRILGGGEPTDRYFLLLVVSLAFYGFVGQATYLPFAVINRAAADRVAWVGCALSTIAGLLLAWRVTGQPISIVACCILVNHVALCLLAPRWVGAALTRSIWRIGLVQLVASAIVLALIPALALQRLPADRTAELLASIYLLSLPIAVALTLSRWPRSSEDSRTKASYAFPLASAAYQYWPSLERWTSQSAGQAGDVGALAFAAKLVNFPISLVSMALGTSRFERIVLEGASGAGGSMNDRRRATVRSFAFVALLSGISTALGVVVLRVLPLLIPGVDLPSLGPSCLAYFAAAPAVAVSGVRSQEALAVGALKAYVVSVLAFYAMYAAACTIAVTVQVVWILPLGLGSAALVQGTICHHAFRRSISD